LRRPALIGIIIIISLFLAGCSQGQWIKDGHAFSALLQEENAVGDIGEDLVQEVSLPPDLNSIGDLFLYQGRIYFSAYREEGGGLNIIGQRTEQGLYEFDIFSHALRKLAEPGLPRAIFQSPRVNERWLAFIEIDEENDGVHGYRIRAIDRGTGQEIEVFALPPDPVIRDRLPESFGLWGNELLYAKGKCLHLYDLDQQKDTLLLEAQDLILFPELVKNYAIYSLFADPNPLYLIRISQDAVQELARYERAWGGKISENWLAFNQSFVPSNGSSKEPQEKMVFCSFRQEAPRTFNREELVQSIFKDTLVTSWFDSSKQQTFLYVHQLSDWLFVRLSLASPTSEGKVTYLGSASTDGRYLAWSEFDYQNLEPMGARLRYLELPPELMKK